MVKKSVAQIEQIERDYDLNQCFDFNDHLLFNRIVQVINIKLEVMQDWQLKMN